MRRLSRSLVARRRSLWASFCSPGLARPGSWEMLARPRTLIPGSTSGAGMPGPDASEPTGTRAGARASRGIGCRRCAVRPL